MYNSFDFKMKKAFRNVRELSLAWIYWLFVTLRTAGGSDIEWEWEEIVSTRNSFFESNIFLDVSIGTTYEVPECYRQRSEEHCLASHLLLIWKGFWVTLIFKCDAVASRTREIY